MRPALRNIKNKASRLQELDLTKIFRQDSPGLRLGLPSVIRAATQRALAAREHRLKDYHQWEEWRRQGREVKAVAVARLEELLQELEGAVRSWGGRS